MRQNAMLVVCILLITVLVVPAAAAGRSLLIRTADGRIDWQGAPVIVDSKRLVTMAELLRDLARQVGWAGLLPRETGGPPVDGWTGGEVIELKVPAIAVGGRVWLPVGQLAAEAGAVCRWDPATGMLEIGRTGPKPPPSPVPGLSYTLVRSEGEVLLLVTNDGAAAQRVTFPTSQRFDLIAVNPSGLVVWRWSDRQAFAQAAHSELIGPGDSRVYRAELPNLSPGSYALRALFIPAGDSPVSEISLDIAGHSPTLGLTYELRYRPATSVPGNDYPRMTFQVMNRTGKAVQLHHETDVSYRVLVFDRHGKMVWEHKGQRWSTSDSEQMSAGSARFFSVRMPSLGSGSYRAEAYFHPAGDHPVTAVTFTVN